MLITVYLRQQDAIKAGINKFGDFQIDIDPAQLSAEQRVVLADMVGGRIYVGEDTAEALVRAIDAEITAEAERKERAKQEEEKKLAEFKVRCDKAMALPDDEFYAKVQSGRSYDVNDYYYNRDDVKSRFAALAEARRVADEAAEAAKKAAEEAKKAAEEAKKAAEEAKKAEADARKKQLYDDFAKAHLSDLQQRKYTAGLMAEDEILEAIVNEVFSPLADMPLYEKITVDDVFSEIEEDYGYGSDRRADFEAYDAETLTDEQFANLEDVKKTLAEDGREVMEAKIRVHMGAPKDDEDWNRAVVRHGLYVRAQKYGYSWDREYALN